MRLKRCTCAGDPMPSTSRVNRVEMWEGARDFFKGREWYFRIECPNCGAFAEGDGPGTTKAREAAIKVWNEVRKTKKKIRKAVKK